MLPTISVIIPVYNEEKYIETCLDSLFNQVYPQDRLEIIVIDNNSTDSSKRIILRYPVIYLFEGIRNRAKARNRGLEITRGEFVAFIDADCYADRYWLRNLWEKFETYRIAGCYGDIRLSPMKDSTYGRWLRDGFVYEMMKIQIPVLSTGNSIFRAKILKEIGYFDETLPFVEDADLTWKVALEGYRLEYAPDAIVYHMGWDRLPELIHVLIRDSYAFVLLDKYEDILYKKPRFRFSTHFSLLWGIYFNFIASIISFIIGQKRKSRGFFIKSIYYSSAFFNIVWERKPLKLNPSEFKNRIISWTDKHSNIRLFNTDTKFEYILNETGSKIFKFLEKGLSLNDISISLSDEFGVSLENAANDVHDLIDELKAKNLIL